jgi:hypothetical protein
MNKISHFYLYKNDDKDDPVLSILRQEYVSLHLRYFASEFIKAKPNLKNNTKSLKSINRDGVVIGLQAMHARFLSCAYFNSNKNSDLFDYLIPNVTDYDDSELIGELVNECGIDTKNANNLFKLLKNYINVISEEFHNLINSKIEFGYELSFGITEGKYVIKLYPNKDLELILIDIRNRNPTKYKQNIPLYLSDKDYNVTLFINFAYLEKLTKMYVDKIGVKFNKNEMILLNEDLARIQLKRYFCLIARYETYSGNTTGMQGAVPHNIFDNLQNLLKIDTECFASPLNVYLKNYYSAFDDTDMFFGSNGSFFSNKLPDGCYEVNPPFINCIMENSVDKINEELKYGNKTFFFIGPSWTDANFYNKLTNNKFLKQSGILDKGKHEYIYGEQHRIFSKNTWKANVDSTWFILSNQETNKIIFDSHIANFIMAGKKPMGVSSITDWYFTNKNLIDSLFKNPETLAILAKCGIVQSFDTKKFCKNFDICETDDYQNEATRIPTNKELENFFQTIYHAGTTQQFFRYANFPENLDTYVYSGFHYLFDIFKKGIYVYIKNGNINVFLPFSNATYRNDWGQNLRTIKGGFKTVLEIEEKSHYVPKFIPEKYHTLIQKDPNRWYANYCIFRNTIYKNGTLRFKDDEGDKSIVNFLQLLTEVCYERNIPDVCFFISPRDFPILRKDRNHPYDRLYKGKPLPYLGTRYPITNGVPIFSQSITDDYEDELIPNDDDIVGMLCDSKREIYNPNWDAKKNMAVFRGSATGCGTTPESNPRLHLYEIAKSNSSIMDVKLIGLNEKIKVDEEGYVQVINSRNYPRMNKDYKEEHSLTPKEQSKFKYIIHVQGHVAAFRLTRELGYGSLILKVQTKWKTWYSDQLVGWKVGDNTVEGRKLRDNAHYLIIDSDLSNLVSTLKWCMENKRNDDICKNIAQRSLEFYRSHFSNKRFMLDYMQEKLTAVADIQKTIKTSLKGLILIPFRDDAEGKRQKQLDILLSFLDKNLDTSILDYAVIVQKDKKKFNRGQLLNEGVVMYENYDYFIFHDADLIPDTDLFKYYYEYPEQPIHLGYRGQRWSETTSGANKKFIGGVLSINKYDFYLANGFPNDFWGWGGEDDALSYRLMINKILVTQPPEGAVTDLEELTIEQKLEHLKQTDQKNMTKNEQMELNKSNWFDNGVKQIRSTTEYTTSGKFKELML